MKKENIHNCGFRTYTLGLYSHCKNIKPLLMAMSCMKPSWTYVNCTDLDTCTSTRG